METPAAQWRASRAIGLGAVGTIGAMEVLKQAAKSGVKYYFIEDESPDVLTQIPVTLQYLRTVKF